MSDNKDINELINERKSKKAVGAYYQRNKELLYLKNIDRLNKIKDDPDA